MSRPRIIRADTLDLQDEEARSAKDNSESQTPSEDAAPYQKPTIRYADHESEPEVTQGLSSDHHYNDAAEDYSEHRDMSNEGNNEYLDGSDEGDPDGDDNSLLDDDLIDKISSSPSIDDEDIDFEFVYALHNFAATVEGQANASKGDTMVLLDDKNSYWWLVRIVKDGSIGYLPAEHIETPTERLARLNKHRNVDLSATMLGDNLEKSKNPLKKAMRRRIAKAVSFSSPTYIEASDVDFDTDDDIEDGDFFDYDEESSRGDDEDYEQDEQQEDMAVEPLKPRTQREREPHGPEAIKVEAAESNRLSLERDRSSEDVSSEVETVNRSRNGTLRNTDSFYKDDSVETKKISLTPNLLRDETSSNASMSELKEPRGRTSLDLADRVPMLSDKGKDDRKRKEKKPGMFSGLFKRKDKRAKTADDDNDETERHSEESLRSSSGLKTPLDSLAQEYKVAKDQGSQSQRQSNRMQKQSPVILLSTEMDLESSKWDTTADIDNTSPTESKEAGLSLRRVMSEEVDPAASATHEVTALADSADTVRSISPLQPPAIISPSDPSVNKTSLDALQDSYDRGVSDKSSTLPPQRRPHPRLVTEFQRQDSGQPSKISPEENQTSAERPGLRENNAPGTIDHTTPVSPRQRPSVEFRESNVMERRTGSMDSASETPIWSDASLRSYMDDDNGIHDLFVIVHDKSNIPPAGPDHPITGSLFKEESRRLREMTNSLDEMLVGWIEKRLQRSTLR